jgi:hypothetical protein
MGRTAKPQRKAAAPPPKPVQNDPSRPRPLPVPPPRGRSAAQPTPAPRPPAHEIPKPPSPIKKSARTPDWSHLRPAVITSAAPVIPTAPKAITARALLAGSRQARAPMRIERPAEDCAAGAILAAGERARSRTRAQPPTDPVARAILRAGAKRRGEI